MGNFFNSINVGLKALQVQKTSLDVTGHNISNANSEGYSRQRVTQTADRAVPLPGMNMPAGAGQLGTGVKIEEINRIRDQFIDGQINEEGQVLGEWEKRYQGLHRIELIFNEPSDSSLDFALSEFWKSLQDLSNNPEDAAVRETVKERGVALADTFHSLHDQLLDYKSSLNDDVATTVHEINSYAWRIADLNNQILSINTSGKKPNDLMDKRDLLFEKLNSLVDVQGHIDQKGSLNINLGGVSFVTHNKVNELEVQKLNPTEDSESNYEDPVFFKETGEKAEIRSGELGGLLTVRDSDIDQYLGQLNEMAETIKNGFNEIHESGYDFYGNKGKAFFTIGGEDWKAETLYDDGELIVNDNKLYIVTDSNGINSASSDIRSFIEKEQMKFVGGISPAATFNVTEEIADDVNLIAAGTIAEGYDYSEDSNVASALITDLDQVEVGHEYSVEIKKEADDTLTYKIIDLTDNNFIEAEGVYDGTEITDPEVTDADGNTKNLSELIGISFTIKGDIEEDTKTTVDISRKGNGANALKMAAVIREDKLFNNGEANLTDHYGSIISELGIDTQRAKQMVENQNVLVDQLNNQRTSISGVSLDEEMANMIQYQQAYNAAAKIITTTDKMLDTLMSILR